MRGRDSVFRPRLQIRLPLPGCQSTMATSHRALFFVCLSSLFVLQSSGQGQCQAGTFGERCQLQCHCRQACDVRTGACTAGCLDGFSGPSCQIQNVALRRDTNASSVHSSWTPERAVDGDARQDPGNDYLCFHSAIGETFSWWYVDLGDVFPMNNIVITYRNGFLLRFNGAMINIANSTGPETTCVNITNPSQYSNAILRLSCPQAGQRLVLRHGGNCGACLLEPCEVQIFVCAAGTYGQDCQSQCGLCGGEAACHPVSGLCPRGCLPGYTGERCHLICHNGTYGQDCSGQCGQCRDGASCHHVNGSCPSGDCQPGYRGDRCDQAVPEPVSINAVLIGGVVAALVLLVLLAAGIVILVFARRHGGVKSLLTQCAKSKEKSDIEKDHVFARATFSRRRASKQSVDTEAGLDLGESLEGIYCPEGLPARAEASSPSCVPTPQLPQVVADKLSRNALEEEYQSVSTKFLATYDVSQEKVHAKKNKFKGYYPYDFNRVVLEPTPDDPHSHYINASHVDGFENFKAFIAAQAPTPHTLNDFVRMLWQMKCTHIAMLTNLIEEAKVKCERYWPETEGEELKCGEVTVTLTGTTEWSYCTLRLLTLTHQNGGSARVKQFHFTTWPDHGVPSHVDMLDFFWKVRASWTPDSGPLLVHCSAGVGRTGTFIALCILSDQAASQHRVDPLATLTALRHQRRNMIQTLPQYEFLHEVLVRVVQLGRTAVARGDFCSHFPGKAGGLMVGHRTLHQLALDIATYATSDAKNEEDAHVYSNSKWNYFTATNFVSSVRVKQGLLMVKLWESGTEAQAPKGLWNFLLDTPTFALLDLHHDKVGCVRAPQGEAEEREGATSVTWRAASLLAPGIHSRELLLQRKGRPDKKLEYIGYDASSAVMPGCVVAVATRLTSQQLSSGLPLVCMYRPSEESCAQLLCAAVNLTQSLRLDGHVELVSSLLRLPRSLDSSLVTSLADVAFAVCQEDNSVYANA